MRVCLCVPVVKVCLCVIVVKVCLCVIVVRVCLCVCSFCYKCFPHDLHRSKSKRTLKRLKC